VSKKETCNSHLFACSFTEGFSPFHFARVSFHFEVLVAPETQLRQLIDKTPSRR
jgi:hypothetical protein